KQECLFHEHPHQKKACSQVLPIVTKEQCRAMTFRPWEGHSLRTPNPISLLFGVLHFIFQLLHALHDLMERVRKRVANIAWIGDDQPLAIAEDDVSGHAY